MTSLTVGGLDVAFSNDYMAFVLVRMDANGIIHLVHLDTWRGFDWQSWKNDMESKQCRFYIDKTYIDETNNQSVVLELGSIGMPVHGIRFSNNIKHDMIQNVTKLLVTGKLVMPKVESIVSPRQQRLMQELLSQIAEQEYTHKTSRPSLTHPSGSHDDLLWALCLALYGIEMYTPSNPMVMSFDYGDPPLPRGDLSGLVPFGTTVTDVSIKMPRDL